MLAFLQNLDYVHTFIMAEYPNINMPSFRCEADSQTDNMVVHYYSHRPGMYPLVEGKGFLTHKHLIYIYPITVYDVININ